MDKQKVQLIIRNIEILLDNLKAELYADSPIPEKKINNTLIDDYDEIYDE
jgi:hypothetical protein